MQFLALLGLISGLLGSVSCNVRALQKSTFDNFIASHDLVLVQFFDPKCPHCKKLDPIYSDATRRLAGKDLQLVKIDCTQEVDLCKEYKIEKYPIIKLFRGLSTIDQYEGERTAEAIVSYLEEQSQSAILPVTLENIDDFKSAIPQISIVGFFDENDKQSYAIFEGVANKKRESYRFGASSSATLAEAEGVKQPAVILYKSFDEGKIIYTQKFEIDSILRMIDLHTFPYIGEITPKTYQSYINTGTPLAYIFTSNDSSKTSLRNNLLLVAQKYKRTLNIAIIDAIEFGAYASLFNLEIGEWPAFAIEDNMQGRRFSFSQNKSITAESIVEFIADFQADRLEPNVKSEPVPEEPQTKGMVMKVVRKTYEQVVMDNSRDVLVMFYAPWCQHSQALLPTLASLAHLYAANQTSASLITIAKIDVTTNDVVDDVYVFPTLRVFPANEKNDWTSYDGDFSLNSLVEFIRENGSLGVDVLAERKVGEADKTTNPKDEL